jgi:hypothetical protein
MTPAACGAPATHQVHDTTTDGSRTETHQFCRRDFRPTGLLPTRLPTDALVHAEAWPTSPSCFPAGRPGRLAPGGGAFEVHGWTHSWARSRVGPELVQQVTGGPLSTTADLHFAAPDRLANLVHCTTSPPKIMATWRGCGSLVRRSSAAAASGRSLSRIRTTSLPSVTACAGQVEHDVRGGTHHDMGCGFALTLFQVAVPVDHQRFAVQQWQHVLLPDAISPHCVDAIGEFGSCDSSLWTWQPTRTAMPAREGGGNDSCHDSFAEG